MLKTARSYLHSSGHNTKQTKGTDGQTDKIPLASTALCITSNAVHCKNVGYDRTNFPNENTVMVFLVRKAVSFQQKPLFAHYNLVLYDIRVYWYTRVFCYPLLNSNSVSPT